jgi:hypothetical protein
MNPLDWPENIYPARQIYFIRPDTGKAISGLTGHIQAFTREGGRWAATLDLQLSQNKAGVFDAFLAELRGPVGTVLVPDFRRIKSRPVTKSMDEYAAETGLSFFDDQYDFDDMTNDNGFLTTEEPVPMGLEENLLLSAPFETAFLLFPDDVMLLTEAGEDLLGENVGIPLVSEQGDVNLTVDFGAPLEIALERGFGFITEAVEDMIVQLGGGFFEGAGQPVLIAGAFDRMSIDGLPPYLSDILFLGEAVNASPGRAHLILSEPVTDINGYAAFAIAPRIREAVVGKPLATGGAKVLMRLADDEAGRNDTIRPAISLYQLRLEEVLP